jgi:hypothetical protein
MGLREARTGEKRGSDVEDLSLACPPAGETLEVFLIDRAA